MPYDYSRLYERIAEIFGTQARFANAIGLSEHTVSMKLNGKVPWKQPEIMNVCNKLGIATIEIPAYFFSQKVQN